MRKTNLFYSQGQDSNFVTFSNYTETLTGVVLATDYKLFPSKFICIYIPKLDVTDAEIATYKNEHQAATAGKSDTEIRIELYTANKIEFITSYLGGYYENKLAVIRDWCLKNDKKIEQNINPLDYLLYTIKQYDPTYKITFIDNICEQDYNGTFMDNICIIENNAPAKKYVYTPNLDSQNQINIESIFPENSNYTKIEGWKNKLYGWANATKMPEGFGSVTPIYDTTEDSIYYINSNSTIVEQEIGSEEANNYKSIKFNILIPLYDVFKYRSNEYNGEITETPADPNGKPDVLLVLNNASEYNQYDIPIGMWFSDKVVELERAIETTGQNATYRPSWSLCISSQFKPFPFGKTYPNEIEEYDNPDKFASFALIMAKQAFIVNEFNTLNANYSYLSTEVKNLSTLIGSLQGLEGNDSDDFDISDQDIETINNKLISLNDKIKTNKFAIDDIKNYLDTSYVKISDLGARLEPFGFLTTASLSSEFVTQSQLDISSYLKSTDATTFTNMLKTSSYIISISSSSNTQLKNTMNEYFNDASTSGPTITKKLKSLCGSNGFIDVFTSSTSTATRTSTINNIANTPHTIKGIIDVMNTSYNINNSYFNSKFDALKERVNAIDGKDNIGGTNENALSFDVPALKNAIGGIENRLNQLRAAILEAGIQGSGNYGDTTFDITDANWADVSNNGTVGSWGGNSNN